MEKPQSATFTISADTPLELARMLRRIADALEGVTSTSRPWSPGTEPSSPSSSGEGTTPWPSSHWWNVERARELWQRLETPGARRALRHLAAHPERVTVGELSGELGKEPGPALAGTLSPIGRAVSAMGAPPPFHRVRSRYDVDPEFARSLRAFLESAEGEASRDT